MSWFEGTRDMRVDPEGPEGVIEVENDQGGKGKVVGEC